MNVREKLVELLREAPYNIFGDKLGNYYFDSCLTFEGAEEFMERLAKLIGAKKDGGGSDDKQ